MKISFKLMTILIAVGLFAVASVGITLLVFARSSIMEVSHEYVDVAMHHSAEDVSVFFNSYLDKVDTISNVMEHYQNIVITNRRNMFNIVLESMAVANTEVIGIWCVWEPNVLEGDDRQYIGTKGTNADGRFAPYYYWINGRVDVVALDDFDQSDYYLLARNSGNPTILNPYEYELGGKKLLITSVCVPIKTGGRVVGVVGFDLPLTEVQNISNEHKPFPDALPMIFSNDTTVVASYIPTLIGETIRETEMVNAGPPYFDNVVNAIKKGESYSFSQYVPQFGSVLEIYAIPIFIEGTTTPWSYTIAIMQNTMLHRVYQMMEISAVTGVVILGLVIFIAVFLSRSISRPIVKVTDTLKDISEGEGDLTRSITVSSKDEIGNLALFFNKTLDKIRNLVINIKKEAGVLSEIGTDLASNMNETAAAVHQINANIQSIKTRIANQSNSVSETHATMEQIVNNINKLNVNVEEQADTIKKRTAFIQAMVNSIESVNQTLFKNMENVKTLKEASEVGRSGLQEVAGDIQEITRESEGLMEINAVMENIASQTNLLSMNAAIEAAHAGEAGKGFAVVADEIRKLAESSSEQSKTIGNVLKKIKGSMDKITKSTETVLARFEAIDTGVKTVAEQEDVIRQAMEEQGEGSKQLLQGTSNLTNITAKVRDGSMEMAEGSKEVIEESNALERATQEISGGMNEMAVGADHINLAIHHVNEISVKNRAGIESLIQEVSRFKVD
ncbi:MAG: methyl-accepting chemotaxis protein [Treponema sp.]|jgi:methyl-accepting chemotaxis protein|nr:methyl-accepting chemotaxis protein [Treponema sp.]